MDKTVLGIIPARGGSKGVPRKNIKELCGKPLIYYIFESARKTRHIDRLILSTEDDEIADAGRSIGIEVPFMRPKELATDDATSISVIKHALKHFDNTGIKFDGVISLQPTNPFTTAKTIDGAIELLFDSGCTSVTAISEMKVGHPYIAKRLKSGNAIEPFCDIPKGIDISRRQAREKAYYMTGAIYMRGRGLIEAERMDGHWLGKDPRAIVVDEVEAMDINTMFDFELAECMMRRRAVEKT